MNWAPSCDMRSKRQRVRQCKNLAKQHVDNPDEPAAPDGGSGFAEWAQITFVLLRAELDKNLRETEAWFNDPLPSVRNLTLREYLITRRSADGNKNSTCVSSATCSALISQVSGMCTSDRYIQINYSGS